ncbi:glycerol-3-phosphate acyltransferase, chloroplastic-like [Phragmites australis]|uniref:glycerol-3-phosphate acyltransferase, chloroplastic-like n=1 Tax=Phragmites australis TaxID=29695 RepID=UPI002D7666BD|nr:glycerol-3-phosphate acyltransferase, chloroplastic-like [Phragmites australis]
MELLTGGVSVVQLGGGSSSSASARSNSAAAAPPRRRRGPTLRRRLLLTVGAVLLGGGMRCGVAAPRRGSGIVRWPSSSEAADGGRAQAAAARESAGGGRRDNLTTQLKLSLIVVFEAAGTVARLMEEERGRIHEICACLHEGEREQHLHEIVLQNGYPNAYDIMLSNMMALFDRVLLDVQNPFTFPPYHTAVREPFDYYMFGQNYIRPLIDFR